MNSVVKAPTRVYKLQPGDATKYVFSITDLADCAGVVSGIDDQPAEYIMVSVIMSGYRTGVTVLSKSQLRKIKENLNFASYEWAYAKNHGWQEVDDYTAMAVLLACVPLMDDHWNLSGACRWMLKVKFGEVKW